MARRSHVNRQESTVVVRDRHLSGRVRRHCLRGTVAAGAALLTGCSPLEFLNIWVPSRTYRATRDIPFGDQERLKLDVYQPAMATPAAPIVVFFYGGNWNSGERAS